MIDKILENIAGTFILDLGSSHISIFDYITGEMVSELNICCINKKSGDIVAIGLEAQRMIGKTPQHLQILYPVQHGSIVDFVIQKKIIHKLFERFNSKVIKVLKPTVIVTFPMFLNDLQKKILFDTVRSTVASRVIMMPQLISGAILNTFDTEKTSLIFDIGSTKTDVAVISYDNVIHFTHVPLGGNHLNTVLKDFFKSRFQIELGFMALESVKKEFGSLMDSDNEKKFEIRGRDQKTGFPRAIDLKPYEFRDSLKVAMADILNPSIEIFEQISPDVVSDVLKGGLYFFGGGSAIKGLDKFFFQEYKLKSEVDSEPANAYIRGVKKILDSPTLRKVFFSGLSVKPNLK